MELKEIDQKIAEHKKFQEESRKRINKLIAKNDPLRVSRYQEKRGVLLTKIDSCCFEINYLSEKLNRRKTLLNELRANLKKLDEDYKNYEPM